MKKNIIAKVGNAALKYIEQFTQVDSSNTLIVSTTNKFNLTKNSIKHNAIVNLSKVNNIRYINKFFNTVNNELENGDIFIGCGETFNARKERKKINKIPFLRSLYFAAEFVFLRVSPKIWGVKKIFFFVTRGRNRLLSKAEILGRLVSCGFEIVDYRTINGILYFVVRKIREPYKDINPSYGPLYKMPRVGKNGRIIGVYKFRTMHPYAEYLHDHILKINGYAESGKPANDFRLTPWGKVFRKYWIDEIPQLINVLKGEIKLVGVRPISQRFFQDIPSDLQKLRLPHKPGCIPPYVALDKSGSVTDVLQAERQYLIDKTNHPYSTDISYFFNALFNIIVKQKRSA
jgi:lipopolysaccharide/colanic/teichoic acid biosynthesis glycosyltransferase